MSVKKLGRTNMLYLSGGLILAAMVGLSIPATLVWAALWFWNRDFVQALGERYVKCVMIGLVASSIFQYSLGSFVNLPSGFTAGALVAIGVGAGLYGKGRGR